MITLLVLLVTTLPPKFDLEKYLAPPPDRIVCTDDMTTYEPYAVPVVGTRDLTFYDLGIRRTWTVEPGYVVSECEFIEIINVRAEHQRLTEENAAMERLRRREYELWRSIETEYQGTILTLRREVDSWWKRNASAIGLVLLGHAAGMLFASFAMR